MNRSFLKSVQTISKKDMYDIVDTYPNTFIETECLRIDGTVMFDEKLNEFFKLHPVMLMIPPSIDNLEPLILRINEYSAYKKLGYRKITVVMKNNSDFSKLKLKFMK